MNWNCPHCGIVQTVTGIRKDENFSLFDLGKDHRGEMSIYSLAIACANQECSKITVKVTLSNYISSDRTRPGDKVYFQEQILPSSQAKPQPDYIPTPLVEDYTEACKIADLSPKASATLARRCLQGMIRDFCKIQEGTLFKEISKLRELVANGRAPQGVSHESVDAIDYVRKIGNIGAHMEKDIDLIVPVEPDEAKLLIGLVEDLFEDWYVSRHEREQRLKNLKFLVEEKEQLRQLPKPETS